MTADPLRDALAAALDVQYEVLAPIGRGAMGAVYLARERFLDRLVAIKALPAELASSPDARERFLREARTAARLTHPHIVPLYSFGEAPGTLFYVMGYVDGESLESRLRAEHRLSPDDARRILTELADALHYAHAQGVVHRDLKPDNILIERATGRAMLTDFGIAKRAAEGAALTGTGIIFGTPHYMSPEQAAGDRALDGRSDLYALGVIGYRMLAGRLPFEGGVHEVLTAHVARDALPLRAEEAPPQLAAVIARLLAKDPAERWRDGLALRTALGDGDGDVEEEALPEHLQSAPGMLVRALLVGAMIAQFGLALVLVSDSYFEIKVATFVGALITPLAMLLVAFPSAVKRLGWREAHRLSLLQPRWWTAWWPRRYRRAGDVWDRLPRPLRVVRRSGYALLFSLAAMNLLLWFLAHGKRLPEWMWAIEGSLVVMPLALAGVPFYRARKWMKAAGVRQLDFNRWMGEPTAGSRFWRRPDVAALLSPCAPSSAQATSLRTPLDQLRAIEAMQREPGLAHQEIVAHGVKAASDLHAAILACDRELGELARDVAPEERARIEASIAALGSPGLDESESKRRMRGLLGDQLTLLRGLEERRADLLTRRERLVGHMHALRLQLATLRAQAAIDAGHLSEITARIRDIHHEVELQLRAATEVIGIMSTPA